MNRENLLHTFQLIYQQLNEEQRKAVDTIYGPVLVIAGPGTGKTQILSARIGKILLETDYLPDNILCLTYTDAGRVAMRKRLLDMIGADAYRVNIHTFHSFCNQVIQENMAFFNKSSLDPVSDLERIEYLKEIIDGFALDHPLRRNRGKVYYELDRLTALFALMKKEGWTSSFVKERADEYLSDLPNREQFYYKVKSTRQGKVYQKGDLKEWAIEDEKQSLAKLIAAAQAFDHYQSILNRENRYDFDDMINWVIRLLEQDQNTLLDYQEKFQFFLVDEYQDTSGAQNRLIELLGGEDDSANVFVVGDDDQSIYRFQGANIGNILQFKNRYSRQLTEVMLKMNYRSVQSILDYSTLLIQQNEQRLNLKDSGIIKELQAAHPDRIHHSAEPCLEVYQNTFQEMAGITRQIDELLKEGVPASTIAIIYREHKWGDELMKFLQSRSIPYYVKRKEDARHIPLTAKWLKILRYIARERSVPFSADDLLFEILHSDLYQIPAADIALASLRAHEMGLREKQKTSFRTYLQHWVRTANRNLFNERPPENMVSLFEKIEHWIKLSFNTPVLHLAEQIMQDGGFLDFALRSEKESLWHLECLRALMDFIKQEMHRHPDYDLNQFMDIVDMMEDHQLSIPVYRILGTEQGVNLLTAHASKGLEFRYVFLMNAQSDVWESKGAFSRTYKLPDTLVPGQVEQDKQSALEEQRRLFYVGMTRAEVFLNISYSLQDDQEKYLEPSRFIAEIQESGALSAKKVSIPADDIQHYLTLYIKRNKQPVIETLETNLTSSLLSRFEMNATALNNFLNCPLRFYYQNLIRVPSGISESSTFGSAVHFALEKIFQSRIESTTKNYPSAEELLKHFRWYMQRHRENFTRESFKRRLEYGEQILMDYYVWASPNWPDVVKVEWPFKNMVVSGVPLKGKIDRADFQYNQVRIVDYKTGDPLKGQDKLKRPDLKNPLGGDYWRQAVFYKLLVEAQKTKSYQVDSIVFQFIEPLENGNFFESTITPTSEDLDLVKRQIKETWQKIQQHEFAVGCGKEDCAWCNFVKDNDRYVQLISLAEAEESQESEWPTEDTNERH